jgi:hypothetical protein
MLTGMSLCRLVVSPWGLLERGCMQHCWALVRTTAAGMCCVHSATARGGLGFVSACRLSDGFIT